ncbi:MAG: KAP family NTPase [Xanthomonadales bacterium]|nr:KAP family NTPase [Xanthomonadales bacterium]
MSSRNKDIDLEDLEYRLKSVYEEYPGQVILFAARCAARVLPLLAVNGRFDFWLSGTNEDNRFVHLVSVWRAILTTFEYASHDKKAGFNTNSDGYASDIAIAASAAATDAGENYYAEIAASAAYISVSSTYATNSDVCTAYAAHVAYSSSVNKELTKQTLIDLQYLEKNEPFFQHPLFAIEVTFKTNESLQRWGDALTALAIEYRNQGYERRAEIVLNIKNAYTQLRNGKSSIESIQEWVHKISKYSSHKSKSNHQTSHPKPEEILGEEVVLSKFNYLANDLLQEGIQGEDALDRNKLANAFAKVISSPTLNHLTIGLLGDWGSGKSFLLRLIKEQLNEEQQDVRFICGEFNAWRYENSGNIQAGIAQEAVSALTKNLDVVEKFWIAFDFAKYLHKWKLALAAILLLIFVGSVFAFFILTFFVDDTEYIKTVSAFLGLGSLAGSLKFLKGISAHPLANELKTYLKLPTYSADLGKVPVMQEDLKCLSDLRLGNKRLFAVSGPELRLLYVVDDLDRCGPEGIVKTLEGIRLMLDIPHVIVIIAIDPRIALAALATHYEKIAKHHGGRSELAIARDYLGKIIHLPVSLSKPDQETVTAYVERLFGDQDVEATEPADGAGTEKITSQEEEGDQKNISSDRSKDTNQDESSDLGSISSTLPPPEVKTVTGMDPQHQTAFKYWITAFDMHNPRQIKRLFNSYNLMRHYYGEEPLDESGNDHAYPRMVGLMLLEWMNEKPREERNGYKKALQVAADIPEELPEDSLIRVAYEIVKPIAWETEVEPFVLPAIENKVIEDKGSTTEGKLGNIT